MLITTHYMDEAERCHRLAYIAYGRLLAKGTAAEVVAAAGLTTWELTGPDLHLAAARLRGQPGVEQVVPFGTTLHVSGRDAAALEAALGREAAGVPATRVRAGLEDVFIHLMDSARDNFA